MPWERERELKPRNRNVLRREVDWAEHGRHGEERAGERIVRLRIFCHDPQCSIFELYPKKGPVTESNA
jgi:hypothetical protein